MAAIKEMRPSLADELDPDEYDLGNPADFADWLWMSEEAPRCPRCGLAVSGEVRPSGTVVVECEKSNTHFARDFRSWSRKLPPEASAIRMHCAPTYCAADGVLSLVDRSLAAVLSLDAASPQLFQRGGELVLVQAGRIEVPNVTQLGVLLAQAVRWTTRDGLPADPPPGLARAVLKLGRYPTVQELGRVVTVPTVVRGGRLLTRAGYDPESRVYLYPEVEVDDIPEHPNEAEVIEARDFLCTELLSDFPFVADADRANAFALVLLPFLRDVIEGPTPLHWVGAPEPGTGKGKLVDVCLAAGCGRVPSRPFAPDEPERRKMLTAAFREGAAALKLDNVRGQVKSQSLEMALTEDRWSDRVLGTATSMDKPIRCVWTLTANNAVPGTDMARRVVPIRLDANTERPAQRTGPGPGQRWRHLQPAWAHEHRPELVRAALVLCRAWVGAGMPERSAGRLGSFESYEGVMAGVLEVAGVAGFLDNLGDVHAVDTEREALAALLRAWHEQYGDRTLTTRELVEDGALRAVLDTSWDVQGVGNVLGRHRDRIADGLRLCRRKSHGANVWTVRPAA